MVRAWAKHLIILTVLFVVTFFPLRYLTLPNVFAFAFGLLLMTLLSAVVSIVVFALTRSFLLTLLYALPFSEMALLLDGFSPSFFALNFAPVYVITSTFAFIFISFIRGVFYDPLVEKLKRKKFSPWPLALGLAISTLVYYIFRDYFLVLGSVMTALVSSLNGAWYFGLYSLASWLSLPMSLDEDGMYNSVGICLGEVKEELAYSRLSRRAYAGWVKSGGKFCIDFSSLSNYNLIVVGSSGSGKSTLVKSILSQLNEINYLVIDPHGEHGDLGEVIDASKVSINPLSLFGASPHQRSVEVASMIKSVFNLGPLQEITLANLIVEAYALKGITDDPSTWSSEPPTFRDLMAVLEREKKLATDAQTLSRLSSLEPYLKFLNESIFPGKGVPMEELFKGKKVLDLSKVSTREVAYIIIETVLRGALYSLREFSGTLKNLIVIDEAPFVLEKESGQYVIDRLASEGRKFGFGLILVSQYVEPLKKAVPNTSLQVFMRLVSPEDLNYASSLLSMGDEERKRAITDKLASLGRGEFIVRDLLNGRLVLVYTPRGDNVERGGRA